MNCHPAGPRSLPWPSPIPGREEIIRRVESACQQGRQAYWVCTLIEESDQLEAQAAEATCQELQLALPEMKNRSGPWPDETCGKAGDYAAV